MPPRSAVASALFCAALEERRVGFGLDDAVEFDCGRSPRRLAVDQEVVHAPAPVTEMEPVVERDLAAAAVTIFERTVA